jgi:hypothetical protein
MCEESLQLNHGLSFVEGGTHVYHNRSGIHSAGCLPISKKDAVNSTVHPDVTHDRSHHLHGVSLWGKFQQGPQLRDSP